jgi:CheY-like chemotaxis protein
LCPNRRHQFLLKNTGSVEDVLVFVDAAQALKLLVDETTKKKTGKPWQLPDIIFLDLKMPGLEGFDFLEVYTQFRDLVDQRILIYVVTSSVHPRDIKRIGQYQVMRMITKPLTRTELMHILAEGEAATG